MESEFRPGFDCCLHLRKCWWKAQPSAFTSYCWWQFRSYNTHKVIFKMKVHYQFIGRQLCLPLPIKGGSICGVSECHVPALKFDVCFQDQNKSVEKWNWFSY